MTYINEAFSLYATGTVGYLFTEIATLLLEICWCLSGSRHTKIFSIIGGGLLGFAAGRWLSMAGILTINPSFAGPVIFAAIAAVVGIFLEKFGIFSMVFFSSCFAISGLLDWTALSSTAGKSAIAILSGVGIAILNIVFWDKKSLLPTSAVIGGIWFFCSIVSNVAWLGLFSFQTKVVCALVIAVVGLVAQLAKPSGGSTAVSRF